MYRFSTPTLLVYLNYYENNVSSKAKEISSAFLKSVKNQYAGEEVEITVKSVAPLHKELSARQKRLLEMVGDSRQNAPLISLERNIRRFIKNSQYPNYQNGLF